MLFSFFFEYVKTVGESEENSENRPKTEIKSYKKI